MKEGLRKKECMINYKKVLKQQRRVEGKKCSDEQVVGYHWSWEEKRNGQSQEGRISGMIAREIKKEIDANEFNAREILPKREHKYEV